MIMETLKVKIWNVKMYSLLISATGSPHGLILLLLLHHVNFLIQGMKELVTADSEFLHRI